MDIKYPTQYISADSIFITNKTQSFNASFDFKTSGSRSWHLYQFPKWLDVTPKEGYLNNNSSVNLQFRIDQNQINLDFGVYTYPLIFNIEDMGLLSNTIVYANLGDPSIEITPNNFEIENTLSNNFEILNRGNGILYWEIINSPSWITIEKNQ
jgi:hypothetical protein